MPPTLLCDRPPANRVDYTLRFVVSTVAGLNVNGVHLEMGDEVPHGALTPYALQCEYQRPPGRIELLEYALTNSDLREACARRGVDATAVFTDSEPAKEAPDYDSEYEAEHPKVNAALGAAAMPMPLLPDLSKLSLPELQELCRRSGLSPYGKKGALRHSLEELLD